MKLFAALTIFTIGLACLLPHKAVGLKQKNNQPAKNLVDNAKLFMTLKSDDVVIRTARGSESLSSSPPLPSEVKTTVDETELKGNNGAGGLKRNKHGGHRKTNRNQSLNHSSSTGNGRKSHMEKKLTNSGEQTQPHQQHIGKRQQQLLNRHNGNQQNNNNNNNNEHQFLKVQQNQEQQKQHSHSQENKRKSIHKTEEQEIANSKTQSTCRYTKSPWSDCDKSTNTHSRTLTLKKGDSNCLPTRTIQKKCKKSCRYEKGNWSECKNSEMTRIDILKTSEGSSAANTNCEATRTVNRKCNLVRKNNGKSNRKERKNKDKDSKQQPA